MTQALIREMAILLASFQRRHMYSCVHIDAGLCGYTPMYFEGRPTGVTTPVACSVRCTAIREVLQRAADVLGVTVDELRSPPKTRRRAKPD